jgi:predicted DNA binding CopG/RHH family protein
MASKINDKIIVPHFATEAEEADWWFDNRVEHDEIMAKAIAEGRTMTMKQVLDQHGLVGPRVAVDLDFDDLVEARRQSAARGLNYEAYVRQLLHEALAKNGAA